MVVPVNVFGLLAGCNRQKKINFIYTCHVFVVVQDLTHSPNCTACRFGCDWCKTLICTCTHNRHGTFFMPVPATSWPKLNPTCCPKRTPQAISSERHLFGIILFIIIPIYSGRKHPLQISKTVFRASVIAENVNKSDVRRRRVLFVVVL